MTRVVSLVSDHQKAEKVINNLTEADLDEIDIRTIDEWGDEAGAKSVVTPAYNADSGAAGLAPPMKFGAASLGLDEEETRFFRQGVRAGGVIVSVEPANKNDLSDLVQIMQQQSDRIVKI